MKIRKKQLKQIIKEELSSIKDLETRLAGMDARRDTDTKKVKHRGARDELNEIARTLQQMFELSNLMVQKKSEHFQNTTVYGLSIREQPALKELADITREYAKHVKDAEAEPVGESMRPEASENLRYANDRVDHIINKISSLGDEIVKGSTQGGPYERMPVDMYIDGADNYDEPRKLLRKQAEKLRLAIVYGLNRPVPPGIRDRLKKEIKLGFLSNVHGIKSTYREHVLRMVREEIEKLDEIPTWRKLKYLDDGTPHPGLHPGPPIPEPSEKDPPGEACGSAPPDESHEEEGALSLKIGTPKIDPLSTKPKSRRFRAKGQRK
tara:strand:- start:2072 stop:3037 length:966 start_codon:yes stop_codon:yes gene_type:complete